MVTKLGMIASLQDPVIQDIHGQASYSATTLHNVTCCRETPVIFAKVINFTEEY